MLSSGRLGNAFGGSSLQTWSTTARQITTSVRKSGAKSPAPIVRHGVSYYWDTSPPSPAQLKHAEQMFSAAPPKLIDSATKFRTVKHTTMPEVAILGRSNVGKSSVLNALMGQNICHTSKHPGRTRSMNFFALGGETQGGEAGKLAVLDMPGYGKGSQGEWGTEILKYLTGRKQLRRVFVLIDPLHGLKSTDKQLLSLLRTNGLAHQVLLSKIDRLLSPKKSLSTERLENNLPVLDEAVANIRKEIQPGMAYGPEALGELICCSTEAKIDGKKLGIGHLRHAVLAATGLTSPKQGVATTTDTAAPIKTLAATG